MNSITRSKIRLTTSEGSHQGAITEFYSFTNSKGIDQLCLTVHIEQDDCLLILRKNMPAFLLDGNPLFGVLDSLNLLPDEGEEFEFASIIGLKVEITIANTSSKCIVYSNIVTIKPASAASEETHQNNINTRQPVSPSKGQLPRRRPISPSVGLRVTSGQIVCNPINTNITINFIW